MLLLVVGLAVGASASGEPGIAAAEAVGARPFVVYDAMGDVKGVPDITSVAVARDAQDRLTFAINVFDHAAIERGEVFSVGIDADRRLATGSHGFDVVVALGWWPGEKAPTYSAGGWDGSDWQPLDVAMLAKYDEHGPRLTVDGSELGVGRSFRFDARAEHLTASQGPLDRIPRTGLASVALRSPATIATIGRLMLPGPVLLPDAGKTFRVTGIGVEVEDAGIDVGGITVRAMGKPDKVRCTARIGRTQLRATGNCTWRVPSTARGKTLMLKLAVAYGGDEWTAVYPLKVG